MSRDRSDRAQRISASVGVKSSRAYRFRTATTNSGTQGLWGLHLMHRAPLSVLERTCRCFIEPRMRFWGLGRKALRAWDLGPCSRNCGLGTINSRLSACHGASLRSAVSRLADAAASEVSMMVAEGQGSIRIAIASRTLTVASETSSPRVRRRRIRSAPTSFSHVQQIARSSLLVSCATWTALARCSALTQDASRMTDSPWSRCSRAVLRSSSYTAATASGA